MGEKYRKVSASPWRFDTSSCELLDAYGARIVTPTDPSETVEDDCLEVIIDDTDGLLMAAAPDMIEWILNVLSTEEGRFSFDEIDEAEQILHKIGWLR